MDLSALERVEAKRKELEATVARLRKSLRHWQTLELDYEGLREEFTLLDDEASEDKCLEVARDFKPEALDDGDLKSLMKDGIKHPTERPRQLAHILSKRVDYVARNVATVRKQLEGEQIRLNAILLVEDPETRDDAGLPLGEITEELDDSGKVVSGKVEQAGGKASDLEDVLQKVGVERLKEKEGVLTVSKEPPTKSEVPPMPSVPSKIKPAVADSIPQQEGIAPAIKPSGTPNDDQEAASSEESDSDSVASLPPNPADSAEEARLRQEMINYNLDTMHATVAELDLAEGASDVSYDEDSDNPLLVPDSDLDDEGFEDDDDDDDEDSEDEKGAAKRLNLNSEYKKQMEQLQKKLGLKDIKNVGPEPELPGDVKKEVDRLSSDRPAAAEAARKAALERAKDAEKDPITGADIPTGSTRPQKASKKKVAFSDAIDIAEEAPTPTRTSIPSRPKQKPEEPNPVNATILERTSSPTTAPPPPSAPVPASKPKVSRFKQQKLSKPAPPAEPTPPQDRILASSVLERPTPRSASAPNPMDIDDEMHRKQMALEYHKLKSRQMHQEGGYIKHNLPGEEEDDEDGDWYTKDEETGEVKKVSRFKAARMR